MYTPVATITHRAVKKDKLNILCMHTHERYQINLAKTGHNFYVLSDTRQKQWNETYGKMPNNYFALLNPRKGEIQLHDGVVFDAVLSQNKFAQYPALSGLAQQIYAPLISLEHTLPPDSWPEYEKQRQASMRGDFNIFLSEYSRNQWGYNGDIIHNAVDTDFFSPADVEKKPYALSIVNEWKDRDYFCGYKIWHEIINRGNIPHRVRGDNPGWTAPTRDVEELRHEYRQAAVFLNTSLVSTCPTTVLEAAACGVPIVTTATTMLPEIIKNGYNGYISNNVGELIAYTKKLVTSPDLAKKMGENARKTMIEKFSLDSFVTKWNELFERTREYAKLK